MPRNSLILPDFIIIGANKAGTTSVAAYLLQHPEIGISEVKEPMFFSASPGSASSSENEASLASPFFANDIETYSRLLGCVKPTAKLFGEASTAYLANPDPSADLIKKICPDVKLIAILRDPSHRAVSAYKMVSGNGLEKRQFEDVINEETLPVLIKKGQGVEEYIRNGLYAQLLERYFWLFKREQMLFINYEELCQSPAEALSKICRFIGVEPIEFDVSVRHNKAEDHGVDPIKVSPETMKKLRRMYRDDIVRTAELTGLDTEPWL